LENKAKTIKEWYHLVSDVPELSLYTKAVLLEDAQTFLDFLKLASFIQSYL
jgi:hypothetical protein